MNTANTRKNPIPTVKERRGNPNAQQEQSGAQGSSDSKAPSKAYAEFLALRAEVEELRVEVKAMHATLEILVAQSQARQDRGQRGEEKSDSQDQPPIAPDEVDDQDEGDDQGQPSIAGASPVLFSVRRAGASPPQPVPIELGSRLRWKAVSSGREAIKKWLETTNWAIATLQAYERPVHDDQGEAIVDTLLHLKAALQQWAAESVADDRNQIDYALECIDEARLRLAAFLQDQGSTISRLQLRRQAVDHFQMLAVAVEECLSDEQGGML